MIQSGHYPHSLQKQAPCDEGMYFTNKLNLTSRKPDFQTLPWKHADHPSFFEDQDVLDDDAEDFSKSTDAFRDNSKKSRGDLSLDNSISPAELKGQKNLQGEGSLWFEQIDKEIYIPAKFPRIRPDSIQKDAVNPEDVRFFFKNNELRGSDLVEFIKNWSFINNHDDSRVAHAHVKGGLIGKESMTKKYRHIAREIIGIVGKKILSGNFNLSTVSFPIKAMIGESALEKYSYSAALYPLYMNLATKTTDPLQRFKFVVTASVSYLCYVEMFGKPLNPIVGETFQGHYNDGTKVYLEQTSHHPPASYMYVKGPHDSYSAYGPYTCNPSAGLNSITIVSTGWKNFIFHDTKQEIRVTNANDEFDGTLFGKCTYRLTGSIELVDKVNQITCKLTFGKTKKKLNDYFEGEIKVQGKPFSKVTGSFLGWLEIDGYRYFDHRYVPPFEFNIEKSPLESDSYKRQDIQYLREGEVIKAQQEKDKLEGIQRNDRKLREAHEKKLKKRK